MIKKIFFIILFLNLNHCDYKPVYSNQNKINYKIVITSSSGDKDINNSLGNIFANKLPSKKIDIKQEIGRLLRWNLYKKCGYVLSFDNICKIISSLLLIDALLAGSFSINFLNPDNFKIICFVSLYSE